MVKTNIAPAKAQLSRLVNRALAGEEVVLCKHGTPAVRLVPVVAMQQHDPCRIIPELSIRVTSKALKPLSATDWGRLLP